MIDFDFHNLLFPTEFEKLCRDIIDIRDSPIKFTTFRRGRDSGIDFRSTNTETKIICQCKLYNPANYSSFLASLKNEIKKCKRHNPDRYIICTNLKLSPDQATEIITLFQGYIVAEEDIIDGEKLNKYLSEQCYQHLLKVYSKLLVPNLQFVEFALEKIINQKYYNKTESFLRQIQKEHKLFHNTQILKHCIEILENNKIIILTGNPGVGKTTTAKMVVNYFLNQKVKNILFLSDNDFNEIEGLYQDNQIIVVDDFWGQNFSTSLKDGSRLRNFNRVINDFKESKDRYLILTSREYIIKDVLLHSEQETQKILNTDRFIVNLDDYSTEDKVRIFLNHLLYYDFGKSFFSHLKYNDTLENITEHKNYSPRHIEYFIKQYDNVQDSYDFFQSLRKYLDKPVEYWNNNFNKLNATAKLILLILLISSDPIDLADLEKSFTATQEGIRKSLNENIEPLSFNHELRLLEDFYLASDKRKHENQTFIHFQSPGIKDFLLEYLRTEGKAWIEPLLINAPFLNQLNFVFSTKDEEIDDFDSDISMYGQKIVLTYHLQKVLKNKLLQEFDSLNFCSQNEKIFSGEFSSKHTSQETKYWKLILLNSLFDISADKNLDARNFIIAEVKKDVDNYRPSESKIVNSRSMLEFPRVIELIKPYTKFNADYLISCYCDSITFTIEFDSLFDFKEIFPIEFEFFIKKNIISLRKAIKYHIIDDIDYYKWYYMETELDTHLGYVIQEVCKKYNIRLTAKFIKEIEDIAEYRVFSKIKATKRKQKKKSRLKPNLGYRFKPKKFDVILNEYLPDGEYENFDPLKHLNNIIGDKKEASEIKRILLSNETLLKPFTENKEVFTFLIQLINQNVILLSDLNDYTIFDSFFRHYCRSKNIKVEVFKSLFFELSKDSFSNDFSITEKQLKNLFSKYDISHYKPEILSPIIVRTKKWYNFSNYSFKIYFIAEYLKNIESHYEFKETIENYSSEIGDSQLLQFLSYSCRNRLEKNVIIPELQRFFSCIDINSQKKIVMSFFNFFEPDFDILWNKQKKEFEEDCCTHTECFIEIIIQSLGIDFSIMSFDIYFTKHYYTEELIQRHFINVRAHNKLYKYIIDNIPKRKGHHLLTEEDAISFNIKLNELSNDDTFYSLIQEIGMEKYILNLLEDLKQILIDFKEISNSSHLKENNNRDLQVMQRGEV